MPKDSGLVVLPNAEGFWFLEISGPYESMDAATGPSGLIDTFDDYGAINGPNDRDGIHIWSDGRDFKTSATP
jgi:hypothetical protein